MSEGRIRELRDVNFLAAEIARALDADQLQLTCAVLEQQLASAAVVQRSASSARHSRAKQGRTALHLEVPGAQRAGLRKRTTTKP